MPYLHRDANGWRLWFFETYPGDFMPDGSVPESQLLRGPREDYPSVAPGESVKVELVRDQ